MSYDYGKMRASVLTTGGARSMLAVHAHVLSAPGEGLVSGGALIGAAGSGDSWERMAVVDFLREVGVLRLVATGNAWQDNVYAKVAK